MPTKLATTATSSKVAKLPILLRQPVPEALGGDRQVSEARYVCGATCKKMNLEVIVKCICRDKEYSCCNEICSRNVNCPSRVLWTISTTGLYGYLQWFVFRLFQF